MEILKKAKKKKKKENKKQGTVIYHHLEPNFMTEDLGRLAVDQVRAPRANTVGLL